MTECSPRGTIYGIGVGPGDPELMTLKAVRLIRECDIIAVPGKNAGPENAKASLAYKTAAAAVPEIGQKEIVSVIMPMTRDPEQLKVAHLAGARLLETYLAKGLRVVYLALGDICIYSSFSYLQRILEQDGYEVRLVSGVPSFCAAAARVGVPLVEGDEPLHVIPLSAGRSVRESRCQASLGTGVFMKPAGRMRELREFFADESAVKAGDKKACENVHDVYMVVNCGMESEQVYTKAGDFPDDAGYFSLIIEKERRTDD